MNDYEAVRSELGVFRSELKYLNDKYHENSIALAKYDILVDTLRKNVHTLKGVQAVMNTALNGQDKKLSGFQTDFDYTKTKILDDLTTLNLSINEINTNLNAFNEKISNIEESSKFKEWFWRSITKNYKIMSFIIMAISFSAILIYELKKLFPTII